jgi:hypothetical protein
MKNRLLLAVTLLLLFVASLAIQQIDWKTSRRDTVLDTFINAPGSVAKSPSADELVLVRTSDSEFLKGSDANPPGEQAEAESTPAEEGTPAEPRAGSERDGKEVREPEIAGADGKEFKEVLDAKGLPPIAAGEATEGGGGGGGGFGGGGGGGGPANEVAAFTEVREVEKEDEVFITTTDVINKTVIRTVHDVQPVPEGGSALTGLGVAAVIFASFLRRRRQESAV